MFDYKIKTNRTQIEAQRIARGTMFVYGNRAYVATSTATHDLEGFVLIDAWDIVHDGEVILEMGETDILDIYV